ncbi:hypothetical protein LINGRAHAP2_LOCUS25371 [Linum grandiflorum]
MSATRETRGTNPSDKILMQIRVTLLVPVTATKRTAAPLARSSASPKSSAPSLITASKNTTLSTRSKNLHWLRSSRKLLDLEISCN